MNVKRAVCFAGMSCMLLCGCSSKTSVDLQDAKMEQEASEQKMEGLKGNGYETESKMEQSSEAYAGTEEGEDDAAAQNSVIAEAGEMEEDESGRKRKLFVVDMPEGCSLDFSSLTVHGQKYSGGWDADSPDMEAYFIGGGKSRMAVIVTYKDAFSLSDIELSACGMDGESMPIAEADLSTFQFHETGGGTVEMAEIGGHLYAWNTSSTTYQADGDEMKTMLTEESILWMDEGASAEALFTELAKGSSLSARIDGEVSDVGSLSVEQTDGGEWALIKRMPINADISLPYILYEKDGKKISIVLN